jgi:hypothetical protein
VIRCHFLFRSLTLLLLLGVAGGNAGAATFCVHDSAELGSALFTADANAASDTIRLVRGTYLLSGAISYGNTDSSQNLYLSGGWDAQCLLRIPVASNTVIDGANNSSIVITAGGDVTFDAITFHRVPFHTVHSGNIAVRRCVFTGTQADNSIEFSADASVVLDSNAFDGKNVRVPTYNGLPDAPPLEWQVINNTFANAQKVSGDIARNGFGLFMTTPGSGGNIHIILANNIAWGNSNGGVHIDALPSVLATHNQWQSFDNADNAPLENGSGGNSTTDPQLDSNLKLITPTSPAINSGTLAFPGGIGSRDAAGGPRQIGSLPDRGAYESPADDAQVIAVTTNADSGSCPSATHCSLRGALTSAAAAGNAQRIEFDLSSCPQTILVGSELPAIVDNLTIDGYSQSGAITNSLDVGSDARLCVVLKGNYASSHGLIANNPASRLTVKGLAFENFGHSAIQISDAYGHVVQGNQFGGHLAVEGASSQALLANVRNILVSTNATLVVIGGPDAGQRNVIDGASLYGIALMGNKGGHSIINNYIGLDADGATAVGNSTGIIVQTGANAIGYNFIAASAYEGVRLEGVNATLNNVYANTIGLPAQGVLSAGNGGAGVRITGNATGNTIGATVFGSIVGNEIAGNGINGFGGAANGNGGIAVESGISNRITGNRIYANYGINIDLGADGPTANDPTDSDSGVNLLQNYPQPLHIAHTDGRRILQGSIYVTQAQRLEAFGSPACGNAGRGDAGIVLGINGRPLLSPIGGGVKNFSVDLGNGSGVGIDHFCTLSLSATSINTSSPSLNNNSSELSECFVDDTIYAHGFDEPSGWACAP